jgi:hypothetical protein
LNSISKTDLEIVANLDKKIEYYKFMIKELEDEKEYFHKKWGVTVKL